MATEAPLFTRNLGICPSCAVDRAVVNEMLDSGGEARALAQAIIRNCRACTATFGPQEAPMVSEWVKTFLRRTHA